MLQLPRSSAYGMAAAALCAAAPAYADVTAQEVWDRWKSLSTSMGQSLTPRSETLSGGVLTVTDLELVLESDGSTVIGLLPELVFTENGDGTVNVSAAPSYPITVTNTEAGGDRNVISMELLQPDLEIRVSGENGQQSYSFSAPSVELRTTEVTENGEPVDLVISVMLEALEGTYDLSADAPPLIGSSLQAAGLAIAIAANLPEEDADFEMTVALADVRSTGSGTMTAFSASQANLAELLEQGFYYEQTITHGPATYALDALTEDGQVFLSGSADQGMQETTLKDAEVRHLGSSMGVTASVTPPGGMLPPLEIAIVETSSRLRMPMGIGDEPQPLELSFGLIDLTASDLIWSMFDPTGALPRDPATLVVELSGTGRWLLDITDPAAISDPDSSMGLPGELESVSIDNLELSIAGAALTGEGDFSFDNSGEAPVPSGVINLRLQGANQLIDTLVAIGLIPQDQAMGARMMLGLFAVPDGPDSLTSTIELTEDGGVLANGQRLR